MECPKAKGRQAKARKEGKPSLSGVLRVVGLSLRQRHGISGCSPYDTRFTIRIANNGLQLADRLVVPDELDHDARGYCLADPDRLYEPPVRLEKHCAGSGKILGNHGVQKTGRDTALDD